jgi:hypothetical protein
MDVIGFSYRVSEYRAYNRNVTIFSLLLMINVLFSHSTIMTPNVDTLS